MERKKRRNLIYATLCTLPQLSGRIESSPPRDARGPRERERGFGSRGGAGEMGKWGEEVSGRC